MFLALLVYITMVILPALKVAGAVAIGLGAVMFLVLGFSWMVAVGATDTQRSQTYLLWWVKSGYLKLLVALALIGGLTPNKEVTWYMVGAYAAEKVVTSDTAKEMAGETKDMFLDLIKKARENINGSQAEDMQKMVDTASKTVDTAIKATKQ